MLVDLVDSADADLGQDLAWLHLAEVSPFVLVVLQQSEQALLGWVPLEGYVAATHGFVALGLLDDHERKGSVHVAEPDRDTHPVGIGLLR